MDPDSPLFTQIHPYSPIFTLIRKWPIHSFSILKIGGKAKNDEWWNDTQFDHFSIFDLKFEIMTF